MTEAEELEMLELEAEEAKARGATTQSRVIMTPPPLRDESMSWQEALANRPTGGNARADALEALGGRAAATVSGAAQGGTFGFADEIGGAAQVPVTLGKQLLRRMGLLEPEQHVSDEINRPGVLISSGGKRLYREAPSFVPDSGAMPEQSAGEIYREGRDSLRQLDHATDDIHPGYHLAGEVGGALLAPVPPVAKGAEGASFLSRVLPYAGQGAVIGGAFGAGKSEGLTAQDVGNDMQKGMIGGAVAGGILGPTLEKGAEGLAGYLKNAAADKAFKAMNGNAKIVDKARAMGYETPEEMRQLGQWGLDNGLIPWSGDAATIVERVNAMLDKIGPKIGGIVDKAENNTAQSFMGAGENAPLLVVKQPFNYNRARMAAADALDGSTASADDASGKAKNFLDQVSRQGKKTPGSFQSARQLKTDAQAEVSYDPLDPMPFKLQRKAVGNYAKDFENQIGDVIGADAQAELQGLNRNFSKGKDVVDLAGDAARRAQQHKMQSHLANALMLAGSGGAAAVTPEAGLGALALTGIIKALRNPGLRSRADQVGAKALAGNGTQIASGLQQAEAQAIADYLRGLGKAP